MENPLETFRKVPSKVTAYFTIAESATDYPVQQKQHIAVDRHSNLFHNGMDMTHATLYNLERGLTLQSEAARHPSLQHQQENIQQEETNKKTVAIPKEASRPNKGNILKSSPTSSRTSIPINQDNNSYHPIVKHCIHQNTHLLFQ